MLGNCHKPQMNEATSICEINHHWDTCTRPTQALNLVQANPFGVFGGGLVIHWRTVKVSCVKFVIYANKWNEQLRMFPHRTNASSAFTELRSLL